MATVVISGGASAAGMALVVVVMAVDPPPSSGLAWEASVRRVDGVAVKGQWRLGFLTQHGHMASYL
jgi:hypothetical protein